MRAKLIVLFIIVLLIGILIGYYIPMSEHKEDKKESQGVQLEVDEPFRITDDRTNQENVAIYGDIIVWQDDRNGNWDIYTFDLTTGKESSITIDKLDQTQPKIHNDYIVWKDIRNQQGSVEDYPKDYNSDIFLFDLKSGEEQQITKNQQYQTKPDIYGDNIVWLDYRNGRFEVFMYYILLGKEQKVSNNEGNCTDVKIYGDTILWKVSFDAADLNDSDEIYLYNITTRRIANLNLTQTIELNGLDINEKYIAWYSSPSQGIDADIFLYNLSTRITAQITKNGSFQYRPIIAGDLIFWTDLRNDPDGWACECNVLTENATIDNWDIYYYDQKTGKEYQVTSSKGSEIVYDIFQDKLVFIKTADNKKDVYVLKFK